VLRSALLSDLRAFSQRTFGTIKATTGETDAHNANESKTQSEKIAKGLLIAAVDGLRYRDLIRDSESELVKRWVKVESDHNEDQEIEIPPREFMSEIGHRRLVAMVSNAGRGRLESASALESSNDEVAQVSSPEGTSILIPLYTEKILPNTTGSGKDGGKAWDILREQSKRTKRSDTPQSMLYQRAIQNQSEQEALVERFHRHISAALVGYSGQNFPLGAL